MEQSNRNLNQSWIFKSMRFATVDVIDNANADAIADSIADATATAGAANKT